MDYELTVETGLSPGDELEEISLPRRDFLMVVPGGALALLPMHQELPLTPPQSPARRPYQRKFLTSNEAATVEAVTGRIIPSDESPGAKQARVVDFIDYLLSTAYAEQQPAYRNGVRRLNELSQSRFKRTFASLMAAEQDSLLAQMEGGEIQEWKDAAGFFTMVRGHTIEGMFADPKYHGNAEGAGWKLLGTDNHSAK